MAVNTSSSERIYIPLSSDKTYAESADEAARAIFISHLVQIKHGNVSVTVIDLPIYIPLSSDKTLKNGVFSFGCKNLYPT